VPLRSEAEPLTWRFAGDFTPVLAKHSKSFSLIDCIAVGVDRMRRNFEPLRKQVEEWQRSELTDVTAKVVIQEAFVEGKLEAPNTSPAACMTSTSSPSMRSSNREQSGVSPTRSLRPSRNWIRFRNSGRQPSWANSSKPGSHNRSSFAGRPRSAALSEPRCLLGRSSSESVRAAENHASDLPSDPFEHRVPL